MPELKYLFILSQKNLPVSTIGENCLCHLARKYFEIKTDSAVNLFYSD